MKQTAVEWLIQKHFGGIENCTPHFRKHIEEAIEMEKEIIRSAYLDGIDNEYATSKDYYNEVFKSE